MFRTLSLCACCRHYPGAATRRIASLTSPSRVSLPRYGKSGRPAYCPFRGLLGVHSRYGLHNRAVTVFCDTLSEGFGHFVTSIAAPVASGWSGCRVGFAPTGKRRLFTAHAKTGHSCQLCSSRIAQQSFQSHASRDGCQAIEWLRRSRRARPICEAALASLKAPLRQSWRRLIQRM